MSKLEQLIKQQQEIAVAIAAGKNKGRDDARWLSPCYTGPGDSVFAN